MYTYKEKIKHYRDLASPTHVQTDLELLKKVDPRNDQLPTFEHTPARYAERILYSLLDVITAEEIRNNRRNAALAKEEAERVEAEKKAAEKAAKEEVKKLIDKKKVAKNDAARLAAEKTKLKDQLDATELERDEALEEKVELEEKLEEAETALEETVAELEAEKKSEVKAKPANVKKKTNTRKSTGKTSKTKTSK